MKYKKTNLGYVVRLLKGEEVVSSLVEIAERENILSGFVMGLGAVTEIKLGYYDLETKEYRSQMFNEDYEIGSLVGNLTQVDGKAFLHAHITISDKDCKAFAGHLFSAKIYATGEFFIYAFDKKIERKLDEEIGLKLLDL